ncbi:MAG: tautomerase family protein [Alphaproteobacteria bacterium]|nr:tautomerase family protein [Alphaproteobacteria bacterium]
MPSTRITTGVWARGRERELIELVQSALLDSLKIPDWDRDVIATALEPQQRIVPSGNSDFYTRIEIILFVGRPIEAKRALYSSIVEKLGTLGIPKKEIKTILIEMGPDNWGIKGGFPASEVDFLTQ